MASPITQIDIVGARKIGEFARTICAAPFYLARRGVPRTPADLASHGCVPAGLHQPDLFAADNQRRQKLSPLIDRINDRYGRCAIGFGLFPPDVRAFKGHAAFHRVPESRSFKVPPLPSAKREIVLEIHFRSGSFGISMPSTLSV